VASDSSNPKNGNYLLIHAWPFLYVNQSEYVVALDFKSCTLTDLVSYLFYIHLFIIFCFLTNLKVIYLIHLRK
jgi:hypothetical protein